MDEIYYHLSIQSDGSIHISRDESIKQPKIFCNRNDWYSCKESRGYSGQWVHKIVLLNKFELICCDIWWKARDMVTCCNDVGIYKNPKITEHFEINVVHILRFDETMIQSYEEKNNLTK